MRQPFSAILKEPPACGHAKSQCGKQLQTTDFVQQQNAAASQQTLGLSQRVTQIARCMQHVRRNDQVSAAC